MNSTDSSTPSGRRDRAALGCLLGGLATSAAAVFSGLLTTGSHVSTSLYRAPNSHDDFILVSLLAALTHLTVLGGVLALRRSGAVGSSAAVTRGLGAVALGTGALFVLELVDLSLIDAREADSGAVVVSSAFGVATLLTIGGLIVAGRAARTSGALAGWRRNALLICAAFSACVLPFTFANAVWPGVTLLGLGYVVLGAAVRDTSRRSRLTSTPSAVTR